MVCYLYVLTLESRRFPCWVRCPSQLGLCLIAKEMEQGVTITLFRHLWCKELCTMSIHFRVVETCVSKPKQFFLIHKSVLLLKRNKHSFIQNPLPVVLLPKKGAYKYSQHVFSLSVTLQHSHLFRIQSPDHTHSATTTGVPLGLIPLKSILCSVSITSS